MAYIYRRKTNHVAGVHMLNKLSAVLLSKVSPKVWQYVLVQISHCKWLLDNCQLDILQFQQINMPEKLNFLSAQFLGRVSADRFREMWQRICWDHFLNLMGKSTTVIFWEQIVDKAQVQALAGTWICFLKTSWYWQNASACIAFYFTAYMYVFTSFQILGWYLLEASSDLYRSWIARPMISLSALLLKKS